MLSFTGDELTALRTTHIARLERAAQFVVVVAAVVHLFSHNQLASPLCCLSSASSASSTHLRV